MKSTNFKILRSEKLKLKNEISSVFSNGNVFYSGCIRFVWLIPSYPINESVRFGVSVPKRNVKLAVKRNLLKRRLRESYRLNKQPLLHYLEEQNLQILLMIIYKETKILSSEVISKDIVFGLKKLIQKIIDNKKLKTL